MDATRWTSEIGMCCGILFGDVCLVILFTDFSIEHELGFFRVPMHSATTLNVLFCHLLHFLYDEMSEFALPVGMVDIE